MILKKTEQQMLELFLEFDEIINKLHVEYEWFSLKTPKGSITLPELFYIYCHIKEVTPKCIFESGVASGRSTIILSECMIPYGNVLAANYCYPGDGFVLNNFQKNYNNLQIINDKGENVIKLADQASIAIIDGPKPTGHLFGRPGWFELANQIKNMPSIKYIFQHDTSNIKNKKILEEEFGDVFECEYIQEKFLTKFKFYGMDDIKKKNIPNIGLCKKI